MFYKYYSVRYLSNPEIAGLAAVYRIAQWDRISSSVFERDVVGDGGLLSLSLIRCVMSRYHWHRRQDHVWAACNCEHTLMMKTGHRRSTGKMAWAWQGWLLLTAGYRYTSLLWSHI